MTEITELMDRAITAPTPEERFGPIIEYVDGLSLEELRSAHELMLGCLFQRLDEKRADSSILFTTSDGSPSGVAGLVDVQKRGMLLAYDLAAVSGDRDALTDLLSQASEETSSSFDAVATVAMLTLCTTIIDQLYAAAPNLRSFVQPSYVAAAELIRNDRTT